MKLKQQPEDFQVEEMTDVSPTTSGSFALYRLTKRGWTTPDALQAIRRRWQLDHRRLSCGGLKDRHALTSQFLTIYRGPQRRLTHQGIGLEYLGKVAAPYTSHDIRANHFRITMRSLSESAVERMTQSLEEVRAHGVPNYFDDQRFGSVEGHGQFVAKALVQGQYEEALKRALAAPYTHDRASAKQEKAILRKLWGNWATCKQQLPRGHARSLVDYLAQHPDDFKGAIQRLKPELRGLYLSAFQSHLWNQMLMRWLREHLRPDQLILIPQQQGEAPMPRALHAEQREQLENLTLPLPSPRLTLEEGDPRQALLDAVLADEGITREQLRLKGLKEMFFSKGDRAALVRMANLTHDSGPDELNAGKKRLTLAFELPRGCYATLIVKRIQFGSSTAETERR